MTVGDRLRNSYRHSTIHRRATSFFRLAHRTLPALAATAVIPCPVAQAEPVDPVSIGAGTKLLSTHGIPLDDSFYDFGCTLGAVGYDAQGRLIGITNAHCAYDNDGHQWPDEEIFLEAPGTQSWIDRSIGAVGTVSYLSGGNPVAPGPNGVGLDYAVIVFDQSKVRPVPAVGDTAIRAVGPLPPIGSIVCKQGATTGSTCGLLLATAGPYFTSTAWVWEGDSGGPVVDGTTLVGILWSAGRATSMVDILADLNRRGEVGAGFTPAG